MKHALGRPGIAAIVVVLSAALSGCSRQQTGSASSAGGVHRGQATAHGASQVAFGNSRREAVERAQETGRPVLLLFHASWSEHSQNFVREAFRHPEVVRLAKRFECVMIDVDEQPEARRHYNVTTIPSLVILTPDGVPLARLHGRHDSAAVLRQMKAALQQAPRRTAQSIFQPKPTTRGARR